MRLKVCGITQRHEIEMLARLPMDFIGLWHGIEGGHADLPLARFTELAAGARAAGGPEPVLVTFLSDPDRLKEAIDRSGVRWVQLHGFQPPSLILALKRTFGTDVRLIKVLHLRHGRCLEGPFIRAYEKAGVDVFLMDKATDDGRLGSTGESLDADTVATVADGFERPFFLAGGLSAANHREHKPSLAHRRFFGIDVDSGARDRERRISADNVMALSRAWTSSFKEGHRHAVEIH